jgi:DNA-binding NtrC family response regulator
VLLLSLLEYSEVDKLAHFVQKFSKQYKLKFPKMTDEFLDELTSYSWPGNVRQLANIADNAIALSNMLKKLK